MSSPASNWFGWAASQLRRHGHTALTPHLPTPIGQRFQTWAGILDAYSQPGLLDEHAVVVGHSSSASFLPRYVASRQVRLRAVVFISGFHLVTLGLPEYDEVNAEVSTRDEQDYAQLKTLVEQRVCYLSPTDPYVPLSELEKFARLVDGHTVTVPDAGHFNAESGYTQFPAVVESILALTT